MLLDEYQDIAWALEGWVHSGALVLPFPIWLMLGTLFIGLIKYNSVFSFILTISSNVYKENQMKSMSALTPSFFFVSILVNYLRNQTK